MTTTPIPISDRLFIDYLRCKYKAYLKFSGKIGVKSDFEIYQDDKNADYRQRAREHLLRAERNRKSFILTGTFEDVKKQNLSVATAISISNDKHSLILDAIERAFQSSPRKPAYHPILFLPQRMITKQDKLLLVFCGSTLSHEQKVDPTFRKDQDKVYFRTSNTILQVVKKERNQQKLLGWLNKYVKFMPPRKCSYCGNNKFRSSQHFSKKVFDLKFFQGGMKRWVTKYSDVDYSQLGFGESAKQCS